MKKRLAVVSLFSSVVDNFVKQIESFFFDELIIEKYSLDDHSLEKGIEADLILISTYTIFEIVKKYVKNNSQIIVAARTITKEGFNKLMDLPEGTKAMLVNVDLQMAVETITLIYQLGGRHLDLKPVYPGIENIPDLDIAITPGEVKHVPQSAKTIIDIGNRTPDVRTIMDIAVKLNLDHVLEGQNFKHYLDYIIPSSIGLEKMLGKTSSLEKQIDILLHIFDDGVIIVNTSGMVYSYNDSAQKITGYTKETVTGKKASAVFPEIPFHEVLKTSLPIKELLIKIGEDDIVVAVYPIVSSETLHGAIGIIKKYSDTERKQQKLRAQFIKKGHIAKYGFDDILGTSSQIKKCKEIAKRMAGSDSSILITGESGTGKELFAQAIHNNSKRKDSPFIPVNCAALPESLLESELFGYEEGAFTGARKGGKPGLFEAAHMGTIFLDEIGEMPINLQTRLLRVLQEREVMRIGGDSIINIDVRIIAATNRDIVDLIRKDKFRKDLYYRLNVIPLHIPPLRSRREDILQLAERFKREFKSTFVITTEAEKALINHNWDGNIRELKNYMEYLANLGLKDIGVKDLPVSICFDYAESLESNEMELVEQFKNNNMGHINKCIFVLKALKDIQGERKRAGRRSIAVKALQYKNLLSEPEIRRILLVLESYGFAKILKGRAGTEITELGCKVLNVLETG